MSWDELRRRTVIAKMPRIEVGGESLPRENLESILRCQGAADTTFDIIARSLPSIDDDSIQQSTSR